MSILEINPSHIWVKCSAIKGEQLGGQYVKSKDAYKLPHNLGAVRDLIEQGYPMQAHLERLEKGLRVLVTNKSFYKHPEHEGLRDYQNQDVNFLLKKDTYGVFSEQRTGKTPITCTLIGKKAMKTIVVCPASLIYDWVEQIERWAKMKAVKAIGTPTKRKKLYKAFHESDEATVLVISRGTMSNDIDLLQSLKYECVVVDEGHFLRNYGTKQSEALYRLGKFAKSRYVLTGTPASNSPDDVFGILKFLYPDRFTSYWSFCERYFKIDDGYFGKKVNGKFISDSREKEYYELMEQYSIQRKRKDVMKWLQGKQMQTVTLEMGDKQRKAYESMAKTFVVEKENGEELDASGVLPQMTRLVQLALHPKIVEVEGKSAKEDYLLEWLENNPREPVVIFSNFTSYLVDVLEPLLKSKRYRVGTITGRDSLETRHANAKKFQTDKLRVLLCNIEAAGVGLTLDRSEVAIFLDRHYNPTWNAQAEDRIVATTQEAPQGAHIIDLVCKDTIDEAIHELVKKKVDITKIVNNYTDLRKLLQGEIQ